LQDIILHISPPHFLSNKFLFVDCIKEYKDSGTSALDVA
jgi:hypothetical protein